MNVLPWPADDLVVCTRDTNGLIYFGEDTTAPSDWSRFFVSSKPFVFDFSVPRFGTALIRSIRKNKD